MPWGKPSPSTASAAAEFECGAHSREGAGSLVEARHDLRNLSAELSGFERRRRWRHQRDNVPTGLPSRPGHRGHLDQPDVPIAAGGFWLRHFGLCGHRSALWHACGLRSISERSQEARHPRDHGFRAEPHLGPASVVQGIAFLADKSEARLVYLARRQGAGGASEQLAIVVWPFGVEIRPGHESVLLPSLLHGAARPELAQSASAEGHVRRHALLAETSRGGVSN